MIKTILLWLVFFYSSHFVNAQPGRLDSSFGNNGIIIDNIGKSTTNSSIGRQAILASDGELYVVFETKGSTFITKRNSNGAIDRSYGKNGFSDAVNFYPAKASIQPDGKIVVVSSSGDEYSYFVVYRYNQNGSLDSSFGHQGFQRTQFDSRNAYAGSVAIQTDGKIVVVGSADTENGSGFATARYDSNGILDSSFSKDGKEITPFGLNTFASAVAIQSDGKIIVAGSSSFYINNTTHHSAVISRYKTDGTPDSTFSKDGKQTAGLVDSVGKPIEVSVNSMAIQKDGKLVLVGSSLIRLNADGTVDNTFTGFKRHSEIFSKEFGTANAMALQVDDKIVLAGFAGDYPHFDFAVARFTANGSRDSSFSQDGIQITDFSGQDETAYSIEIQKDGKIVAAGADGNCEGNDCSNRFAVARYHTNGTLDNSFDNDGKLTGGYTSGSTTFGRFAVQKDGKPVVIGAGSEGNFIARYNADGKTLDKTFSGDGAVFVDSVSLSSISIQNDGKIVVAGNNGSILVARYNEDGKVDSTFDTDGKQITNFGGEYTTASSIAIQKDGKIIVAGTTRIVDERGSSRVFALVRYNTNGSVDWKNYADFGVQNLRANSVGIQPNGKIVVAGDVYSPKHSAVGLAIFNTDGSIYTMPTTAFDDYFSSSMALQDDGKIVVAGNYVFRFTAEGALDNTFSGDGKTSGLSNNSSVTVQDDNKIVVGGSTFTGNAQSLAVARFDTLGNLDPTFNGTGIQVTNVNYQGSSNLNDISIFNNKIYAAGTITNSQGYELLGSYGVMARYLLTGSAPPIVKITSPTNDTIYTAPARIKINVSALPVNATISKVEFYSDTTLLHTETVFPYGFQWRNVPAGNYTLTAKAIDSYGLVTTSDTVKVSVVSTVAPTANIIKPINNKVIPGPSNIRLEAVAKDPDGNITKVDFYIGNVLLATVTEFPYTYVWRRVYSGNYAITAKATDNMGVVSISAAANITVVPNKSPTVNITNPANEEYFTAPAAIPLMASAEDADGRIIQVEFYNGTTLLRTEYKPPYTYFWPNVPSGIYTITAVARDNLGFLTTSAPVKITVITPNAKKVLTSPTLEDHDTGLNNVHGMQLTPNPVTGILNISIKGFKPNKPISITVLTASGVVVKSLQTIASNQSIQVDVSSLSAGVYTVKVLSGDKAQHKRFVKL